MSGSRREYRQRRQISRARRARQRRLLILILAVFAAAALVIWLIDGCRPDSPAEQVQAAANLNDAAAGLPTAAGQNEEATSTVAEKPPFETLAFPAQLPDPPRSLKLPVLMFHHVGSVPAGADEIRVGLTVSDVDFESMMAYLKQAGYQTITPSQLFKSLFTGAPLPEHPVMITFDDGYLDNYQNAAPVLEKYGLRALVNIIVQKIGTPEYMSWDQVAELERKNIDIGSHTMSHPDLTSLAAAELKDELSGSSAAITSHLGHPVYWLCYPAGDYDADVVRSAREAGYLLAFSTDAGETQSSDAPLVVKRYRVRNDTGLDGFKELVR